MDAASFARLRPYLYHLTASQNVLRLSRKPRLLSTALIFAENGDSASPVLGARRVGSLRVASADGDVVIRDQRPLFEKNIRFEPGWNFARFCRLLNSLVFFWPGDESGPIEMGRRHTLRYSATSEALSYIRVPTLAVDPSRMLFSRFNSGAPRWSQRRPSPRGASTFGSAAEVSFPSAVMEVAFADSIELPASSQVTDSVTGNLNWRTLTGTARSSV